MTNAAPRSFDGSKVRQRPSVEQARGQVEVMVDLPSAPQLVSWSPSQARSSLGVQPQRSIGQFSGGAIQALAVPSNSPLMSQMGRAVVVHSASDAQNRGFFSVQAEASNKPTTDNALIVV